MFLFFRQLEKGKLQEVTDLKVLGNLRFIKLTLYTIISLLVRL